MNFKVYIAEKEVHEHDENTVELTKTKHIEKKDIKKVKEASVNC